MTLAQNFATEAEVDAAFAAALAAGGTALKAPEKVFWGGYSGYWVDPDGHVWEVAMNPFWPLAEDGSLLVLESDAGSARVATVTLRQNVNPANYWIGDAPVFTATFTDTDGNATDLLHAFGDALAFLTVKLLHSPHSRASVVQLSRGCHVRHDADLATLFRTAKCERAGDTRHQSRGFNLNTACALELLKDFRRVRCRTVDHDRRSCIWIAEIELKISGSRSRRGRGCCRSGCLRGLWFRRCLRGLWFLLRGHYRNPSTKGLSEDVD